MPLRLFSFLVTALFCGAASLTSFAADKIYSGKPIKALLVTGGCCHNYPFQAGALTNAINAMANVEWTILNEGGNGTKAEIELYSKPDWAKPYDIVIHNECFADTTNATYIRKITEAHKAGKPAIVIHCAMHTYREWKTGDDWREFLGVTSRHHEALKVYTVKPALKEHTIMKGFPESWTTPADELYVIEKIWPGTKGLATSASLKDGKEYPVAWVHEYNGARVFGTTFGHSDATFKDPVFLNLVSRGFLWASGKLK